MQRSLIAALGASALAACLLASLSSSGAAATDSPPTTRRTVVTVPPSPTTSTASTRPGPTTTVPTCPAPARNAPEAWRLPVIGLGAAGCVVVADGVTATQQATIFKPDTNFAIAGFTLDSSGTIAYIGHQGSSERIGSCNAEIVKVRIGSTAPEVVGRGINPAISPDGRRLAYATFDDDCRPTVLVVRTLASGKEQRFAGIGACTVVPAWAPDSTSIAVASSTCIKVIDTVTAGVAHYDSDGSFVGWTDKGRLVVTKTQQVFLSNNTSGFDQATSTTMNQLRVGPRSLEWNGAVKVSQAVWPASKQFVTSTVGELK